MASASSSPSSASAPSASVSRSELAESLRNAHSTIFYLGVSNLLLAIVLAAVVALYAFQRPGAGATSDSVAPGPTVVETEGVAKASAEPPVASGELSTSQPKADASSDAKEEAAPQPEPATDGRSDEPRKVASTGEDSAGESQPAAPEAASSELEEARKLDDPENQAERVEPEAAAASSPNASAGQTRLQISAVGKSWLRIRAINGSASEIVYDGVIKKGETYDGSAEKFEVMAGIPDQIRYVLDGDDQMKPLGKDKSPLSIMLPEEGE